MTPQRPTQRFVESQVEFHEAGVEWYEFYGQSSLAAWSRSMANEWRKKLTRKASGEREPGDGE